jgi:squalene-hopene/tetraprenyl-beta-curcumene cyclase
MAGQEAVAPGNGQEANPSERTRGTLFKGDVDRLVRGLRRMSPESGALGDGTVLQTAQALTAMGYCHRLYTLGDGPVVRKPVDFLFSGRREDGSFADSGDQNPVRTTQWVLEALRVMDPEAHAQELREGERWLAGQSVQPASGWQGLVEGFLDRARSGQYPEVLGSQAVSAMGEESDPATAVRMLTLLVACQRANKLLDQDQGAAGPPFSGAQQKGINFLLEQQEGGVFFIRTPGGNFPDAGLTGMALAALQTKPASQRTALERATVQSGLDWLLGIQNADGSFGEESVNYTTCAAINALAKSTHPRAKAAMEKAQTFILAIQNIEDRGYSSADRDYGSIGYGGDERGDLSNLQFAMESLRNSGLEENHEAFAKAIVFLQRTQNLRSVNDFKARTRTESGDWQEVVSGNDGGAAYYPGNSPAGYIDLPDGTVVPRSYGSMTYALLKAYTLAGIDGDDPRVQKAVDWIRGHWTLEVNPGADPALGESANYQGLFYYYTVMAQALAAADVGEIEIPAAEGRPARAVDWREALRAHLEGLQAEDGSWVNDRNNRWWEDQGLVCTFYALLALDLCW